ncbi:hypothetical protein BH11PSE10_BH11PSE10_17890 [soil metagenome]
MGRSVVITGAAGGLGDRNALASAGAGAPVVLTGPMPSKGAAALEKVLAVHPRAAICDETLELGRLSSAHDFHLGQMWRRHGAAGAAGDDRWFRAAVRSERSQPLRLDGATDADARAGQVSGGRLAQPHRPQPWRIDSLREGTDRAARLCLKAANGLRCRCPRPSRGWPQCLKAPLRLNPSAQTTSTSAARRHRPPPHSA